MKGLILVCIFWVIRYRWMESRKRKAFREKSFPGDWVEQWFKRRSIRYFKEWNFDELYFLSDIGLHTCRANVFFWLNLNAPHLIFEVAYPVLIPPEKIASIRILVKQFNDQINAFNLMLEKNSGRLYFRYQTKEELFEVRTREKVIEDFERIHVLADNWFTEIMRVLYGNSFPELASLKIFGFSDPALN